jgi:hypothetical protein
MDLWTIHGNRHSVLNRQYSYEHFRLLFKSLCFTLPLSVMCNYHGVSSPILYPCKPTEESIFGLHYIQNVLNTEHGSLIIWRQRALDTVRRNDFG